MEKIVVLFVQVISMGTFFVVHFNLRLLPFLTLHIWVSEKEEGCFTDHKMHVGG